MSAFPYASTQPLQDISSAAKISNQSHIAHDDPKSHPHGIKRIIAQHLPLPVARRLGRYEIQLRTLASELGQHLKFGHHRGAKIKPSERLRASVEGCHRSVFGFCGAVTIHHCCPRNREIKMGPLRNSKETKRHGKADRPAPTGPKEHIANGEQIVYIAPFSTRGGQGHSLSLSARRIPAIRSATNECNPASRRRQFHG
jgi:hypothetical protein